METGLRDGPGQGMSCDRARQWAEGRRRAGGESTNRPGRGACWLSPPTTHPGATHVRRSLIYNHHLELPPSLPLGSAFSALQIAPGENLPPSARERQFLPSVLLVTSWRKAAAWKCIPLDIKECIFLIYSQARQGCLRGKEPMGISTWTND